MINLETNSKLLYLRGILNYVNHISYSYSRINQQYPIDSIQTPEDADVLITSYKSLMSEITNLLTNYENRTEDR